MIARRRVATELASQDRRRGELVLLPRSAGTRSGSAVPCMEPAQTGPTRRIPAAMRSASSSTARLIAAAARVDPSNGTRIWPNSTPSGAAAICSGWSNVFIVIRFRQETFSSGDRPPCRRHPPRLQGHLLDSIRRQGAPRHFLAGRRSRTAPLFLILPPGAPWRVSRCSPVAQARRRPAGPNASDGSLLRNSPGSRPRPIPVAA